ncbi:RNA polymerase sigma-70 factor [Zobellia uliginosa]|uniref:RNA polymerase sigma-70 factor n=1 Tax=Zobellia uliginosa TaxID=143224 RepID=UPI00349FB64C
MDPSILKDNKPNTNLDSFLPLLRKGDQTAYEALFRIYYDKLLHIAEGYLGSEQEAEDVVQSLFLKVWERKHNFGEVTNLNNYLFTMTKNACLDQLKHEKVKDLFSKNYSEKKKAIQNQFIMDETASSILEKDLEKRIKLAIEALPQKCKNVFMKSRVEGMNHSEIAKALDISKRTVDNHISNALKHMRLHLKEFLTLFL